MIVDQRISEESGLIRFYADFEVKSVEIQGKAANIDEQGRMWISCLASTPSIDLDNDIVEPAAFKSSIDKWGENPVMLAYHDKRQPIGLWTERRIADDGLFLKGFISSGRDDIQRLVFDRVLAKASIGYIPRRVVYDTEKQANRIMDLDLYEVSLVPIPANTDTYVETMSKALREWSSRVRPAPRIEGKSPRLAPADVAEIMAACAEVGSMVTRMMNVSIGITELTREK